MGVEASGKKLYIRLPVRIEDEFVVKDLHPNIAIVHLPRQKSRRWCIIDLGDQEPVPETIAALKKIRINDKPIVIKPHRVRPLRKAQNTQEVGCTDQLLDLLVKNN